MEYPVQLLIHDTHSVTFDLDFFVIVSKNKNEMYQDEKKVHFVYTYMCVELGRYLGRINNRYLVVCTKYTKCV